MTPPCSEAGAVGPPKRLELRARLSEAWPRRDVRCHPHLLREEEQPRLQRRVGGGSGRGACGELFGQAAEGAHLDALDQGRCRRAEGRVVVGRAYVEK